MKKFLLKDHNKNYCTNQEVKNTKDNKFRTVNSQNLKKKLLEKDEESSCLRNLNQRLLEQIKKVKR
jgi:hypothetical protein